MSVDNVPMDIMTKDLRIGDVIVDAGTVHKIAFIGEELVSDETPAGVYEITWADPVQSTQVIGDKIQKVSSRLEFIYSTGSLCVPEVYTDLDAAILRAAQHIRATPSDVRKNRASIFIREVSHGR